MCAVAVKVTIKRPVPPLVSARNCQKSVSQLAQAALQFLKQKLLHACGADLCAYMLFSSTGSDACVYSTIVSVQYRLNAHKNKANKGDGVFYFYVFILQAESDPTGGN